MRDKGHDVTVIGPDEFKTLKLPGYAEIDLALFPKRKLQKLIHAIDPDHIHIAVEGPLGLAARKICNAQNIEYTTCYHSHFPDYVAKRMSIFGKTISNIIRNKVIDYVRWFHKHSKHVFVATQSLEDTLKNWGFKTPMVRLMRGIDRDIFYPPQTPKQKNTSQKPTLLYVGRVSVEKSIEDFLSIDIDAHKIVVGDGPDLKSLRNKYKDVEFTGYKTKHDLASYYHKADVFVFPSKTDTFGIVLIEALACGVPVAAYPVTGPVDIITHDALGQLDDNLTEAVNKTLNISTQFNDQVRYQHVLDHYSWDAMADIFLRSVGTASPHRPQTKKSGPKQKMPA